MIKLKPFCTTHRLCFLLAFLAKEISIEFNLLFWPRSENKRLFPMSEIKANTAQLLPFVFQSNVFICMMFIRTSHLLIRPGPCFQWNFMINKYRMDKSERAKAKRSECLLSCMWIKALSVSYFPLSHKTKHFFLFDLLFFEGIRRRHTRVILRENFSILLWKVIDENHAEVRYEGDEKQQINSLLWKKMWKYKFNTILNETKYLQT